MQVPAVGGPVPGRPLPVSRSRRDPGAIFGQGTAGHPDQTGSRWGGERADTQLLGRGHSTSE